MRGNARPARDGDPAGGCGIEPGRCGVVENASFSGGEPAPPLTLLLKGAFSAVPYAAPAFLAAPDEAFVNDPLTRAVAGPWAGDPSPAGLGVFIHDPGNHRRASRVRLPPA